MSCLYIFLFLLVVLVGFVLVKKLLLIFKLFIFNILLFVLRGLNVEISD
ncbi:hypothetical protein SAMN04488142_1664 [Halomonas sp. hl-4]|nr:hypothetical protein SAMN04488142_1664 [Halomonas sp. hl-4]